LDKPKPLKIIFMGTSEFAVPSLDALAGDSNVHEVVAVVTQPDRPKGRSGKPAPPPVKEAALRHGLTVLQPERVKDKGFVGELAGYGADIIVVASYGQLLSERILNMPKFGCVNVHASLLPKYRGASPIQAAIMNGDETSGVTVMQMDKGLDTGDMILTAETPIHYDDTAQTLHDRLAVIGASLLLDALGRIADGSAVRTPQDNGSATHAGLLTKESGRIDWSMTPKRITDLVRGLDPWPGAWTVYDGQALKIWKTSAESLTVSPFAVFGQILSAGRDGITVNADKGAVKISELQAPGGKRLPAADFIKGRGIEAGKVFN
jgi:methionyl-tRNA formyltransferase